MHKAKSVDKLSTKKRKTINIVKLIVMADQNKNKLLDFNFYS